LHAEEASFSPVGAPRVTADPVFLSEASYTVADDADLVVKENEVEVLGVDATSVDVEFRSGVDTAGDGTVLGEVGLHLVGADDVVVLVNIVSVVSYSNAAIETIVTNWGWGPGAVTAFINWCESGL